jgi:Spy/CpxP family protein refolding chaperone
MKPTRLNLPRLLLAAALALPLASHAKGDAPPMLLVGAAGFDGPGGPGGSDRPGFPGAQGGPGMPQAYVPGIEAPGFGPGGRGGPGGYGDGAGFSGHGHMPFRGLQLTEAQEDKIFNILHGQAPYLREQRKAEEKAMRALHDLRDADKFDDAAASKLAQAAAQAHANITLSEIRTHQKLLSVLTPEQRKQLDERKPRMPRP